MGRSWWVRLFLVISFVVMSVIYVTPTLLNLNSETTSFPYKKKINLGLDLQGGLYMVLGVDFDKVFQDNLSRRGADLERTSKEKGLSDVSVKLEKDGFPADDPRLLVNFGAASKDKVREAINDLRVFRVTAEKDGQLELGLNSDIRGDIRDKTLNQSIEVIRNRIDEFGVSEPAITSQGLDRIVVELPGVKEIERAKELIGRTAKLEFRMVDTESMAPQALTNLVQQIEKDNGISYKEGSRFSEYAAKINEKAKGKIPEGREISFERMRVPPGVDPASVPSQWVPYLLFTKADVTGEDLQDANVGLDQMNGNRPVVHFSFNPLGAKKFGELTTANVRKSMAIVLDNIVHSAPVINEPITGGSGQITLGQGSGDKLMKEAQDLAIVLRAGALPAQLEFQEQRVIGPTLGQDSIKAGARAGIVGCLAIFIFMIFYYRLSGVVAAVSLVLNATFLLAILIGMDATLTLPGMAGIALTIGMAVDSNVLIFERIRDELHEGKAVPAAVEAGFGKAFTAIFDANITHGIIAVILMTFGTGPIRGFAVALLIGIITTLFCAVTFCKLCFDGYLGLSKTEPSRLSI